MPHGNSAWFFSLRSFGVAPSSAVSPTARLHSSSVGSRYFIPFGSFPSALSFSVSHFNARRIVRDHANLAFEIIFFRAKNGALFTRTGNHKAADQLPVNDTFPGQKNQGDLAGPQRP